MSAEMLSTTFCQSEYSGVAEDLLAPVGQTINDWLTESGFRARLEQDPIVIRLNGEELMEAQYGHVLREGDVLELQQFPRGLETAVLVLKWVYYTAVAVSAIQTLTAPEPGVPEAADVKEGSPTYTLSARGNRYRPDRKGPVLYGTLRIVPDFDQPPFSTFDANNDQTLHMLFRITQGQAEVDINSIKFEDTPLANFSGVQTEVLLPGEPSTLFPEDVIESNEVSNIELTDSFTSAYVVNDVGTKANILSFDITSPGISKQDKQTGALSSYRVSFEFEAQELDDDDQPVGSWFVLDEETDGDVTLGFKSLRGSSRDPLRRTFAFLVEPGRYQVRMRRITPKDDSQYVQDTVTWMAVKAQLYNDDDSSICTRLAIKVRASEQIGNRALSDMSVIASRRLDTWDSENGWSAAPEQTNSIAWALADLCRASYAGNRSDLHYDLTKLEALDAQLTPMEHYFHGYFDSEGTTVWDALVKVGTIGRITPIDRAGFYTFVRDEFQSQAKQAFTMRNIIRGSFSIEHAGVLEETADSVLVRIQDEDNDYKKREILCALPDSSALNPREIELFGCTNATRAKELGMFLAASNRYRRKMTPFETGLEGRIPFYGAKIAISHFLLGAEGVPQVSGDIVRFDGQDKLVLSEKVAGRGYSNPHIIMIDLDGEPMPAYPVTILDDYQVQVDGSPDWSQIKIEPGYKNPMFVLGDGQEYITESKVIRIERQGDAIAVESFVDDPRVYLYGDDVEPPPDLVIPGPQTAAPILRELEAFLGGTVEAPVVTLSWSTENADRTDIQISDDGGQTWEPLGNGFTRDTRYVDRPEPGEYVYRVAPVNLFRGEWKSITVDTGDTEFAVPAPPTNLAVREPFTGPKLKLQWESDSQRHYIEVRTGANGTSQGTLRYFETIEGEQWDFAGSLAQENSVGRDFRVRVFAVGENGKTSDTAAEIDVSNPAPAQLNNLAVTPLLGQAMIKFTWPTDADIEGISVWQGAATGFSVGEATLVLDRSRDPVLSVPVDEDETAFIRVAAVDAWGNQGLNVSGEFEVTGKAVDLSAIMEELDLLEEALGELDEDLVDAKEDLSGLSGKFPIEGTDISEGAVSTENLAANAVTAEKVEALAITTAKLAALAVSADKIAAEAVSADKIAANAVTAEKIQALAITAGKIAANAVSADKIDVATLSAITANLGTVTAGTMKTTSGTGNRVEISSSGSYPIWIGSGSKTAANGVFYMDSSGDVYFKGELNVKSSATGERLEIDGSQVRVYDSNNTLRVRMGVW